MEIWIPSRGRPTVLRDTLQQFDPALYPKIRIACTATDPSLPDYRRLFDSTFRVFAFGASGIADKRRIIGEHVSDLTFFMMDDDIRFFRRKSPDDYHLVGLSTGGTVQMLDHVEQLLLGGYAAVGISAREGNNRLPYGLVENTRLMRAVGFRTDAFVASEHGRVEVMEDFDILLQLLRRGFKNCLLSQYAQDQRQTNAPGGCSIWRTHELHDRSARKLAELHPSLVSLRQKVNKTGGDFGTRTEVTIAWKKAYAEGQSYGQTDS